MTEQASRRTFLIGTASVFVLGGCATYDQRGPAPQAADEGAVPPGVPASQAAPASAPASQAPPVGKPLASTSDIPVGGGKVFADQAVVVTQPQAGTFKAFTAVCTHAGCTVGEVKGGTINCPCHGSKFKAADGSVAQGPAARALKAIPLRVADNAIFLAV